MVIDPNDENASMGALTHLPLLVRDGCVLLDAGNDAVLPIWPKGYTAGLDASDRVVIRDAADRTVAIEGQAVDIGGGFIAQFKPADKVSPKDEQIAQVESKLGYALPEQCLSGLTGIFLVGETTPIGLS